MFSGDYNYRDKGSIIRVGTIAKKTIIVENIQISKACVSKFKVRSNVRIFFDIEMSKLEDQKAIDNLKKLNDRRNKLNTDSHQIPKWAFEKARNGIEDGEAKYKIDEKK